MEIPFREESLKKTQAYLETLYNGFEAEIEKMTLDIHLHKALREQFETSHTVGRAEKKRLQAWRRKSYALHQRRARLKSMKDCLARQIHDLRTALDRLNVKADVSTPFIACRKGGSSSPLDLRA